MAFLHKLQQQTRAGKSALITACIPSQFDGLFLDQSHVQNIQKCNFVTVFQKCDLSENPDSLQSIKVLWQSSQELGCFM